MKSLYELSEKLYNEFFIDVQECNASNNIKQQLDAYLINKYDRILAEISAGDIKTFMLEEWYKSERKKIGFMSVQQKLGMISKDEYLVKVEDASRIIFRIAMDKKNNNEVTETKIRQAEECLQSILSDIVKVSEVNMVIAQKALSEAQVETNYIQGISDNYSFRMATALKYKN